MLKRLLPSKGLLVLIAAYVLGGWALALSAGAIDQYTFFLYSKPVVKTSALLLALFVGWRFVRMVRSRAKPESPIIALYQDLRKCLFTREKLLHAVPLFIGFMVFMSAFTSLKALIPIIKPFIWDASFSVWDEFIHFGVHPWEILQPLLGYPWITSFLNIVYNLWFPVMFAVLYWQLFDLRDKSLRSRFFWTFFLTWMVNGTVIAMLFPSMGPCFYEHVVSNANPYTEQMSYLRGLLKDGYPIWAVTTQDMLWQSHQSNALVSGAGISAMPSVHVALVVLFALLAREYGRNAQIFFTVFAVLIFLGSVHLAWHYAVDGYVGALVTVVIWWIAGWFTHEGKNT